MQGAPTLWEGRWRDTVNGLRLPGGALHQPSFGTTVNGLWFVVFSVPNILFGNSTAEDLKSLNEQTFLDVFDGVPQAQVERSLIEKGLEIVPAFSETGFLKSNGEVRRALSENSISVNKEKVKDNYQFSLSDLICDRYILLQRGKKNYFLLVVS